MLCVYYQLNKWASPPTGPLFVFLNLSDAIAYAKGDDRIYRCRTKNLRPQDVVLCSSTGHDSAESAIRHFWAMDDPKNSLLGPGILQPTPPGTYIADAVMLTKRVR